jgi:FlaA1/EpsC-like NDP-sugar epimerase
MIGCKNIVELSVKHRVKKFVCISTDKAVHPSNAMGASKRFCELLCLSFNAPNQLTKFSVVRFGNVAGSSGSVIPIFTSQIEAGGPVTVTHPDATRYMMLITEAVKLVIKATILKTEGSGITVLDMGKPRKILNIAKELIDIHGKQFTYNEKVAANSNGETIQITFSGLKEGEKLHEKLSYSPKMKKTDIEKILWEPQFQASPKVMLSMVNRLEKACLHGDAVAAKKLVMTELKNLENTD